MFLVEARGNFETWIKDTWKRAPGKIHRHVKGAVPTPLEITSGGGTLAKPSDVMEHHRKKWEQAWTQTKTCQSRSCASYHKKSGPRNIRL